MHYPTVVLFFTLCFIFLILFCSSFVVLRILISSLPLAVRLYVCLPLYYFPFRFFLLFLHSNSYFLSCCALLTWLYSSLPPQATCFFPIKPFKLLCAQSYFFYFMVSVSFPFITKIFALFTEKSKERKSESEIDSAKVVKEHQNMHNSCFEGAQKS